MHRGRHQNPFALLPTCQGLQTSPSRVSTLHPHPGAMSDYDGNEDHIVDNIISSDEEEEEGEDSKAPPPPARSANGTAKPGTQFNGI